MLVRVVLLSVWSDFDAATDEASLDLFLFKNRSSANLIRKSSVIFPHWLKARDASQVPRLVSEMNLPEYGASATTDRGTGDRELLTPAQDTSATHIEQVRLKWRDPPTTLVARKRSKI